MATTTVDKPADKYAKPDHQIQRDVMAELLWEPRVEAEHVGVAAQNGVVMLTGHVSSDLERRAAEKAAKRVAGVRAVVNELEVRPEGEWRGTDEDLATAVANALKWNLFVPSRKIKASVSNGWVTLEGEVNWNFQRVAAEDAVRELGEARGITNKIRVKPKVPPENLKADIEDAFRRSAALEARGITVDVEGGKVILRGTVHSWSEREAAERAAWSAPGVAEVENQIIVEP